VGSGEESTKVIRAAYRMASSLKADWLAIHVDSPRLRYTEEQRNAAIQHLRLAEKLGAETRILMGSNIVSEIIGFARERNVTKIVMWKHIRPRLRGLFFRSLVDELVRHSGEIDVYIITSSLDQVKSSKPMPSKRVIAWRVYGIAFAIVAFATLVNYFLFPFMKPSNLIMVYLLSVTLCALFGRMGPAILASILSVLAYDFFFIPPIYSFAVNDIQSFFTLIVMLFVTMTISHLTILTQRQAQAARLSERRTAALHTLSRQLAHTRGTERLLKVAVRYLSEAFDSEILALLPVNNQLTVKARYRSSQKLSEKEKAVAQWVFDLGEIAGLGTDTLPFSDAIYIPLFALKGTIGVLRVRPMQPQKLFTPEQMQLLEDCANQIALSVEVDRIHDHKK
jgi:two-component system sensor histidine kinase KdpD